MCDVLILRTLKNQIKKSHMYILFCIYREYQRTIEFKPLNENDMVEDHQITVCVRKRPLNKKEIARKEVLYFLIFLNE